MTRQGYSILINWKSAAATDRAIEDVFPGILGLLVFFLFLLSILLLSLQFLLRSCMRKLHIIVMITLTES